MIVSKAPSMWKTLIWFKRNRMVSEILSKRIFRFIRLMTKIKAIGISFLDGMWFATYTVGSVMVFLWAIGFISFNF